MVERGRRAANARGEVVVAAVMRATFEELGRVGYGALRLEDVADRAGVNKTTVYRRWPTKMELVTAALFGLSTDILLMPDTGSLREDLKVIALRMVKFARTMEGRAIFRLVFFDAHDSPLQAFNEQAKARGHATGMPDVVNRAIARGEVPVNFPRELLTETLYGALICKALSQGGPISADYVESMIDALLDGLLRHPRVPKEKPKARVRARTLVRGDRAR